MRRGLLRLAASGALLWFVFWTFAYVIRPQSSENVPFPPALSLTTEVALAMTMLLAAPWVVLGFRSDQETPPAGAA